MLLLLFPILGASALLVAHSVAANELRRAAGLSVGLLISLGTLYLVLSLPDARGLAQVRQEPPYFDFAIVGFSFSSIVGGISLAPVWLGRLLRAPSAAIYGSALLGALAATFATPYVLIVLVCSVGIDCI